MRLPPRGFGQARSAKPENPASARTLLDSAFILARTPTEQRTGDHRENAMRSPFMKRLGDRFKYGLLTQEFLDRLGQLGVRLTPYLIVDESPGALVEFDGGISDCVFRSLDASDMHVVANMPNRKRDLAQLRSLLDCAECLGAFVGGTLAGYTWSRYDRIGRMQGRIQLHQLNVDEAYLFDMYVDKEFRGLSLAPLLRHRLFQQLTAKGVRRFYSITTYFNRSSRKFKAKLGAQEFELRMAVSLWSFLKADFLLRRYKEIDPIRTKRAYFV